ncbi:uncharacterized protein BX663DRAFT_506231 [Cokeromyces recurvatus]|uniref:uncharacterized protein n=1 Tax=Cokeromyces recurvatus TaxID=90255 RepID=UPI00221FFED6|nr:uncharacterized protein BX663DRAFT_506231 [Cokeromyces recurvatus]KAI7904053.1 hypothetical protein BX663DRAFT_506231 [Cokeromyces recurvatus]
MASGAIQQRLPPGLNFSEAFWDDHNKGIDVILNRLRKSKDTCEEIKKLYELRANIEQEYGEKLLKLAISINKIGIFEENSFADTLSRIPATLEITARAHIDLAQQLKDHLEAPLDGFLRDQRDMRKMHQQQIENSRQLWSLHETDVVRTKEYYSTECTKLKTMEKYLYDLKNNDDFLTEKATQIEKEIEEQRRLVMVAEQVYRRSVDNFNTVNKEWVNNWSSSVDIFQEMEIKRMTYLRSTLWSYANIMTSTFSTDEECCDRIRSALELIDVQKDITAFVQRYGTGNRVPGPLAYETFYHFPSINPTNSHTSSLSNNENNNLDQSLSSSISRAIRENNGNKNSPSQQSFATTIITNPDEELKSVEQQLQQLEVQNVTAPKAENKVAQSSDEKSELALNNRPQMIPTATYTTDQSNGPVSTAIKEVEQILNQESSNNQEVMTPPASSGEDKIIASNHPSLIKNNSTASTTKKNSSEKSHSAPDDFSDRSHNASSMNKEQKSSQLDLAKEEKDNSIVQLAPLLTTETHNISSLDSINNNSDFIVNPELENNKYKPMPNPSYNTSSVTSKEKTGLRSTLPETALNNQQRPTVNVRTSSLIMSENSSVQQTTTSPSLINSYDMDIKDEENEEDKKINEYQNRLPRPPPKDEKWVISSIRRPQQLPVRTLNATMFDGTAVSTRINMKEAAITVHNNQQSEQTDDVAPAIIDSVTNSGKNNVPQKHIPKVHKPAVPLKIEIPNSIKPPSADQKVEENKQSPQQLNMDDKQNTMRGYISNQNGLLEDGGIRPAPWQDEHYQEGAMNNYNRGIISGNNMVTEPYSFSGHQKHLPPNMIHPHGGAKASEQQETLQSHDEESDTKKRFGKNKHNLEPSGKSKESKTGRFSLGFFANKKEKKKEKEAAAQQERPLSQHIMHQQPSTELSQSDLKNYYVNNPTAMHTRQTVATTSQNYMPDHNQFVGYAKAQWPFEATIEGEMSFFADEVLGIIRKQMDGWWEAERLGPVNAGQRGLIPGNYMLDNQPRP